MILKPSLAELFLFCHSTAQDILLQFIIDFHWCEFWMIVVSFGMEALCIEELCKLLNNVFFLLEEVSLRRSQWKFLEVLECHRLQCVNVVSASFVCSLHSWICLY